MRNEMEGAAGQIAGQEFLRTRPLVDVILGRWHGKNQS